jgi:hypothetical protein
MLRKSLAESRGKRAWVSSTRWIYHVWRAPLKRLALIAAVACICCFILLRSEPKFSNASAPQRFSDAVLEIETVRDVEDLRLTLGDVPSADRETMRLKTKIDFAFIVSYGALFVALGILLSRRGGWRRIAGVALGIGAIAAAVFDVLENLAILAILDVPIALTTETMLSAIRNPSTVKWSLIAICAVLLLSFYEPSSRSEVSSSVRSGEG